MILLMLAIVMSIIFLTVEIPVYLRYREEVDGLILIVSALMLVSCIIVLYYWR